MKMYSREDLMNMNNFGDGEADEDDDDDEEADFPAKLVWDYYLLYNLTCKPCRIHVGSAL